jgi:hypothetical protein
LEAKIISESELRIWDNFVDESDQGSIYSKSYYLKSIGCPFDIYAVEQHSAIIGGIVLTKNKMGICSNPLFVKYLGILYGKTNGNKRKLRNKIDRALIDILPRNKVIIYNFHPNYFNWLNLYWKGFSQTTYYTYQINFNNNINFRDAYIEKVKGPIRKAKNNNLKIVDVDLECFCKIISKTYKSRGTKMPISSNGLKKLMKLLIINECVYVKGISDDKGNIHSVAAIVYDENSANLILNGNDPLFKKLSGNSLLIDHMIDFSSRRCELFDFEGSMHRRIEQFYSGYGGQLTPYYIISNNNFKAKIYMKIIASIKYFYK